jgi:hypothetical protein
MVDIEYSKKAHLIWRRHNSIYFSLYLSWTDQLKIALNSNDQILCQIGKSLFWDYARFPIWEEFLKIFYPTWLYYPIDRMWNSNYSPSCQIQFT